MKITDAQLRESKIDSIREAVAHLFGLSAEELRQVDRRRVVAVPRQIAIYLTKHMTDASLAEIGQQFGGRHHTTVMQSIAKVHEQRCRDPALDHVVTKLLASLTHR
jgi:chromosomal replication initiator protein